MKIDYDLMNKINTANNNFNYKGFIANETRNIPKLLMTYIIISGIIGNVDDNDLDRELFIILGIISARLLYKTIKKSLEPNINKNSEEAKSDLHYLVDNINKTFNENIDPQSIEKAKVEKVRYKPMIINGLPALKQNKYISVLSYSEFNNFGTTSILQEHVLVSDEYELTINKKKNH